MIRNTSKITPFYQFRYLQNESGILHFVSSRHGGVSNNASSSLNMQFTNYDNVKNVQENRNRLAKAVGFSPAFYTTAEQIHSDKIAIVNKETAHSGAYDKTSAIKGVDALITAQLNTCLMVRSADCVPILLYDPKQRVIGAIHAGWRSTLMQIAAKTVMAMQKHFNSNPTNILVGIGPSIGACCFEIGDEVVEEIRSCQQEIFLKRIEGKNKQHFDLWASNAAQLREVGVSKVEIASLCTSCLYEEFFSYRRNGVETGQLGTGILIRDV